MYFLLENCFNVLLCVDNYIIFIKTTVFMFKSTLNLYFMI